MRHPLSESKKVGLSVSVSVEKKLQLQKLNVVFQILIAFEYCLCLIKKILVYFSLVVSYIRIRIRIII